VTGGPPWGLERAVGTVVALPHRTNSKVASELVPANALIGKKGCLWARREYLTVEVQHAQPTVA